MNDYQTGYFEKDDTCPCGCGGNIELCVYASTCKTCKKKYAGIGYANTAYDCFDCEKKEKDNKEIPF